MLTYGVLRVLLVALVLAVGTTSCAPAAGDDEAAADGASEDALFASGPGSVALPLATQGRFIVDANGKRLKLVSANWYGAESPDLVPGGLDRIRAATMARYIRAMGFNSVRLPWSNELVRRYRRSPSARLADPPAHEPSPDVAVIAHRGLVAANPGFDQLHPLEIFDRVVEALTDAGLLVILDNHTSRADWCCDDWDGNGLWYRDDPAAENRYTEDDWLEDWRFMARRYRGNPRVVGAELRNELRPAFGRSPAWGGGDAKRDWHAAAQRGGNAVLSIAPDWLVFVDGLQWSTDLHGVWDEPVVLSRPHRVVYAPHDYAWFHPLLRFAGYDGNPLAFKQELGRQWGYILTQNQRYTAPVWVSEFGTCADSRSCFDDAGGSTQGQWLESMVRYLREADIDWAYWAINPTQSSQQPDSHRRASGKRLRGAPESYGLLMPDWTFPSRVSGGTHRALLELLMTNRDPKEGP